MKTSDATTRNEKTNSTGIDPHAGVSATFLPRPGVQGHQRDRDVRENEMARTHTAPAPGRNSVNSQIRGGADVMDVSDGSGAALYGAPLRRIQVTQCSPGHSMLLSTSGIEEGSAL